MNLSAYDENDDTSVLDILDTHAVEDPLEIITKKEYYELIENRIDELDLEKVLDKKHKRRRRILILTSILVMVVCAVLGILGYYYGNKAYLRADVKIYSSSKIYSDSEPKSEEDIGEGALFILLVEGIKRDDFLSEYEVLEISINGENIDLSKVTYRHLNNALSMRMHSEKYDLEKGNVIIVSVKDKNSGQILTKRLFHKTEVL